MYVDACVFTRISKHVCLIFTISLIVIISTSMLRILWINGIRPIYMPQGARCFFRLRENHTISVLMHHMEYNFYYHIQYVSEYDLLA